MNNSISTEIFQATASVLVLAVSSAVITGSASSTMVAGSAVWPEREKPNYEITQIAPSYSQLPDQLMRGAREYRHADFVSDVASVFASLNERQQRLGAEFEAAILSDLDSLYES